MSAAATLRSALVWPRAALASNTGLEMLAGSTVLVTGASSGIGRATAELLGAHRVRVLALARSEDRLAKLVTELTATGGQARAFVCDLSAPDQVAATLVELADEPVTAVVSNAGRSIRRSIYHSGERDDLGRSWAVNVRGPAQLLLGLVPMMVARGGGTVVNVSTVSAKPPAAPGWGTYQSTKAAFDVWLRAAAPEWRVDRVAVRTVYMPLVATPMSAANPSYRGYPQLSAEQAARVVAHAVISGRSQIAPWWLAWQELLATALPGTFDRAFQRHHARRSDRASR